MLRLLSRFVRRHPLVTVCAIAGVWWWWPSAKVAPSRPQAAVIDDGFAAIDSTNHVVEFDRDGERRHELTIRDVSNPRLVGFASGLGAVWRDGKKVVAASVDSDGKLGKPTKFGKNVQLMCEGTASNEHHFAVGWTEPDGAVWIVFGPTSSSSALEAHSVYEDASFGGELARPTFCAVASADDKTGLLWDDGSKVYMTMCGKKCPSSPTRVELGKGRELLGFGCVRDACVIAARNGGTIEATWVNSKGRPQWTKPLRDADPDARLSFTGTGTQVAIAYATGGEPVVVAASRSGGLAPVWQGKGDDVPSIQWAAGRLVIARHVDGELVATIARVP